ncbi:MAG: ABC transporter ATP-binding protein [Actinomycetota bacterium]
MARLTVHGVGIELGGRQILTGTDVEIADGSITVLIGPNGSGKTTLLRVIGRALRATEGVVMIDGEDMVRMKPRHIATQIGTVPQGPEAPPGLTVAELVEHGRYPHLGPFGRPTTDDHEAVHWALEETGLVSLADRPIGELSGGERQTAWIALALAQRSNVLLLDEPTTYLDLRHQLELLDLIIRLRDEHGITILAVLHDLNHALRVADHVVAMSNGRIDTVGSSSSVINPDCIRRVFGAEINILRDPASGHSVCVPVTTTPSQTRSPASQVDSAGSE